LGAPLGEIEFRSLMLGPAKRSARANVPPGRSDIRTTRRCGAHLFGWALLPRIRHAKRVRRAGTTAERRV